MRKWYIEDFLYKYEPIPATPTGYPLVILELLE
jgi:hypothetical protein